MKLFFRKMGAGQPILILHGLFGSGDNWQSHAKTLSAEYTVYLVDQRNHGHSPHDERMDYEVMSEDLLNLIADEDLRDVILIGHSMGGKTVLHFAAENPYLVDRVLVVDMGIKKYPSHHDRIFEGLLSAHVESRATRKDVGDHLSAFVEDPATLQFLLKNLYWKDQGALAWRFNLPVLYRSIENILAELPEHKTVQVQTRFLKGENSGYIQDTDVPGIRAQIKQAEFRVIRGAGHWPHAEQPDDFIAEVMDFLRS